MRCGADAPRPGTALPYSEGVSETGPVTQHRAERILAYMFVGIVGLSIAAFVAVMVGTLIWLSPIQGLYNP